MHVIWAGFLLQLLHVVYVFKLEWYLPLSSMLDAEHLSLLQGSLHDMKQKNMHSISKTEKSGSGFGRIKAVIRKLSSSEVERRSSAAAQLIFYLQVASRSSNSDAFFHTMVIMVRYLYQTTKSIPNYQIR